MITVAIEKAYEYNPAPLREAAGSKGLTNEALGTMTGYHEVHVCRVLQGKTPSERAIRRLCEALSVPIEDVLRPI